MPLNELWQLKHIFISWPTIDFCITPFFFVIRPFFSQQLIINLDDVKSLCLHWRPWLFTHTNHCISILIESNVKIHKQSSKWWHRHRRCCRWRYCQTENENKKLMTISMNSIVGQWYISSPHGCLAKEEKKNSIEYGNLKTLWKQHRQQISPIYVWITNDQPKRISITKMRTWAPCELFVFCFVLFWRFFFTLMSHTNLTIILCFFNNLKRQFFLFSPKLFIHSE